MSDIGRIVDMKAAVLSSGPSLQAWAWVWGVPLGVGKDWNDLDNEKSFMHKRVWRCWPCEKKEEAPEQAKREKLDKIKP